MCRLGALPAVLLAACRFGAPDASGDKPVDAAVGQPDASSTTDAAPTDAEPQSGLGRKKRITIDPTKVSGDQTAFPVWIALTDADLMARATMNGADIHFTRPDGTALEHQIQRWTKQTGRLEAWVRVDLADAAPTEVDLRYGDPATTHAPAPAMVFASSFEAVWHLDDSLAAATVADATSKRNGTAMGGLGASDQIAAQLGGGITFDGNDTAANQIRFTSPYTANGTHTISAWVDQKNRGGTCDSIVTLGSATANESRWLHSYYNANNQAATGFYGGTTYDWSNPQNMNLENAGWTLVHWVYQNRESRLYKNGQLVDMRTNAQDAVTQGTAGYLGYAPSNWGTCTLNGTLDEVRLATVARSAGWIATEYENQKSPQTFYAVGPEQQAP
jgi:acyl dehydratase